MGLGSSVRALGRPRCAPNRVFVDFGSIWGSFGLQFSENKGPCAGLGPKPAPGQPKGSLLSAFWSYFGDIWDGF